MYCPVYGCYSDSQKHTDEKIHFFEFPKASKGPEEIKRRNVWINFCKRKHFTPTRSTRICLLHFSSDAFDPSSSPEFLKSINFTGTRRVKLKDDAVPTENKPLQDVENEGRITAKRATGTLSRRKVGHDELYYNVCLSSSSFFVYHISCKEIPNTDHDMDRHKYFQLLCVDVHVTCYNISHID